MAPREREAVEGTMGTRFLGCDSLRLGMMAACALALSAGCDGNGATDDGGVDSGTGPIDAGCPAIPALPEGTRPTSVTCPTDVGTPAPDEQMGTCCYRNSNAAQLDAPEMRFTFLDIVAPIGSPLSSMTVRRVLNEAMQQETFNWLYRVEGAGADGTVNITTGFGRRQADGTYAFSSGAAEGDPDEWCPVALDATLAGETLTSGTLDGAITVPIFDDAGVVVQVELTLRNVAIDTSTWGEDRSCVGWKVARPFTYQPAAILSGYIEVEPARTGIIMTPGVETSVCAALAGSLSLTYCEDNAQTDWMIKPDSLCDATGCRSNTPCMADVCDPATECNAWRLVAHFAAAGVDITNGLCAAP